MNCPNCLWDYLKPPPHVFVEFFGGASFFCGWWRTHTGAYWVRAGLMNLHCSPSLESRGWGPQSCLPGHQMLLTCLSLNLPLWWPVPGTINWIFVAPDFFLTLNTIGWVTTQVYCYLSCRKSPHYDPLFSPWAVILSFYALVRFWKVGTWPPWPQAKRRGWGHSKLSSHIP